MLVYQTGAGKSHTISGEARMASTALHVPSKQLVPLKVALFKRVPDILP